MVFVENALIGQITLTSSPRAMISSISIFRTSAEAHGFFDSFLDGLFLVKGIPITLQLSLYLLIPLLFGLMFAYRNKPSQNLRIFSRLTALSIFLISNLLLFQPWDEVFVNLMHSYNFAEYGTFSFSALKHIEGTVDFLPYLILGCLAKIGFPLPELLFLQGIIGGLLCLCAGQKILQKLDFENADIFGFCLLTLYVPLLLNSATGFTTLYFSAAILWSVYFLLFENKFKAGVLVLSAVPLIRIEGIWFVAVLSPLLLKRVPIKYLIGALLPFAVLSIWRFSYFGSLIPVPLQFKSSLGSLFYFIIGMRNLASDLIATHFITSVTLLFLLSKVLPKAKNSSLGYKILLALGLGILPYYLSGGDWFPPSWGRYLFFLSFFALLLLLAEIRRFLREHRESTKMFWIAPVVCLFLFEAIPSFGAYRRFLDYALSPRKILAEIRPKLQPAIPYRVQYLSQVGNHFLENSEQSDRIATSELATINYFAKREAIDLLGITNTEIASRKLRQTPDLWRRSPRENELPYLIFKRVDPSLVDKYKPEFIYPFDFFIPTLIKDLPFEEWTNENVLAAFKRWQIKFKGLTRPLYGDLEKLVASGYRPVIVVYSNAFSTLYFVSEKIADKHFASLKEHGFVKD